MCLYVGTKTHRSELRRGRTHNPIPNIDADIYLDHSTVDNGCVWAIPGYHLVGHVQFENFTDQELFTQMGAVPIELGPGDVSFHCLSANLRRTFTSIL